MATAKIQERCAIDPLRIGEPRNETEQKALAALLTALRSEAESRLGCPEPSRLEQLLHTGEGSDLVILTRGADLRLHRDIVRLSSSLFHPDISRLHLNWSEPAAHALASFMYSGKVVVPTSLLWDTYRVAREAGVRSLCCLLRTYSYFPLRLTSTDQARHVRRFAGHAGLARLRALTDDYLATLANESSNVTLVVPVPKSWVSGGRVLPIGRRALAVAFQRRPAFEHDTSSSLILRASDQPNACRRLLCVEPESSSSSSDNASFKSSGSLHSDSVNGPLNDSTSSPKHASDGTTQFSSSSSDGSSSDDDEDAPAMAWLYVLCPKREAGVVTAKLLSELKATLGPKPVPESEAQPCHQEVWTLDVEHAASGSQQEEHVSVSAPTAAELQEAMQHQQTRLFAPAAGNGDGIFGTAAPAHAPKMSISVRRPTPRTLHKLLSAADTLSFGLKDGSIKLSFGSLSAGRAALWRLSSAGNTQQCNDSAATDEEDEEHHHLAGAGTGMLKDPLRARAPVVVMKTIVPTLTL